MAHVLRPRVAETSTTTGTGAFTLAGALTAHRRFNNVMSTSDTTEYMIVAVDGSGAPTGDWEEGIGTYNNPSDSLARTTVTNSSNSGSAVNFAAGSKIVLMTPLASRVGGIPRSTAMVKGDGAGALVAATANTDYLAASGPTYTGNLTGGSGIVDLGTGRFYKDSDGNLTLNNNGDAFAGPKISMFGSGSFGGWPSFNATATTADAFSASQIFYKSRGTFASKAIVQSGDYAGYSAYRGWDGGNWMNVARIEARVDGTPSSGTMPGRLDFYTGPASGGSDVLRMKIDSSGNVNISGLTASRAVFTDASKNLVSATPGTDYVAPGTATTFTAAQTFKGFSETVFPITDSASPEVDINPANGTIQTWTLGGNRTPTASSFAAGQSVTLMINDSASAYTVTWTAMSVTWVGGSAPTLAPAGGYTIIELWKVGSTIYGALVGQVT